MEISQLNNNVRDTNSKITELEKTIDTRLSGIEAALSKTYLEALENKLDSVD